MRDPGLIGIPPACSKAETLYLPSALSGLACARARCETGRLGRIMIALIENQPGNETMAGFFGCDGALHRGCAKEGLEFDIRPQQTAMAEAVEGALSAPAHLAVEAGTGVGKTYAYLVPLVRHALRTREPAAVSTYTISLQEQLVFKDIPFLQRHLGLDFKAALCKGRGNYLCLRRLQRTRRMGGDLFRPSQEAEVERLWAWAHETSDGSLSDLAAQPSVEVWDQVCSEADNCLGRQCADYGRCFLMRARARAFDANLLVLNHHLFFSDLALREESASFLPEFRSMVFDEAHCLEAAATEHLGLRLSQFGVEHMLRRLYVPETNKGLLVRIREGRAANAVSRAWDLTHDFFAAIRKWSALEGREATRLVEKPLAMPVDLAAGLAEIALEVKAIILKTDDPDIKAELTAAERRAGELRDMLGAFLNRALDGHVYWVEREGAARRNFVLNAAPVEVGPALNRLLFGGFRSVVLTSATLSIGGSMEYFRGRVGAEPCGECLVGSPFDYARQMRVVIARDLPMPTEGEAFADAVARALPRFILRTRGRAFVLFTSGDLMRNVASRLEPFFRREGITLFLQGDGLPNRVMLERFRGEGDHVLFGLASFWMGVDVRGEALGNVIIVRLPFSVPDEPVVKARMDLIEAGGGDPFKEYSLPEAVLKFRQGVGRLIRTASDEGIIVILDARVIKRWYGRRFLEALPECPVEIVDCLGSEAVNGGGGDES